MKTKHTPAPWVMHKWESEKYKGCEIVKFQDIAVCALSNFNLEANAKLIAAAPELLEALEYFVKCHSREYMKCEIPDAIEKSIEAIKKATT